MWGWAIQFLRTVFGGIVFGKAFEWGKRFISFLFRSPDVATGTKGGIFRGILGKFYNACLTIFLGAEVVEVIGGAFKKLLGWIGVGGAVVSGGANVNQAWHLLGNIDDPQKAVLDWLSDALSHLPSVSELILSIDSVISSSSLFQYINPVPTVTNLLRITGAGWAFNQLLMSAIQNMIFIFSVFIVRWAFGSNFTFTKNINKKAKT